ncbi:MULTISPECIES: GDSL-type esterase/lipase family protein [unclassified Curtobacterium]|uniref:GDSL-type esterase/lipase family protein n=1 Tax=unclassified Curtobacterium TaxID=257496 RepID=UPI0015E8E9C4|nr:MULTISPECIES: GDSL-type esterase/lipase family protein [unclassified Curtobacterium]
MTGPVLERRPGAPVAALVLAILLTLTGCTAASTRASGGEPTTPSAVARDPLATWNAAVEDRAHAPARWVAVGDSLSEGQGASTRSDRWLDLTLAALREAHPTEGAAGGAGYLPAEFAVYGPDSTWGDWASATTGSTSFDDSVPDLGYRAVRMLPGSSRTYTFTGTGVDIWWTRYPGSGSFTYRVDSSSPVQVDTDGAASTGTMTKVDGLTAGKHTVTVSALGTVDLEGFTVYDGDRDRGVTLLDATHSGATVGLFTKDEAGFLGAMRRAAPDLVTITLGGNDAKSLTADQLLPDYERFVRALRRLPSKPSVLVIGEFAPGPSMQAQLREPWSAYRDVAKRVAAATGSAYVSIADAFPGDLASRPGISPTDDLHPDDRGQRTISRAVLRALRDGAQ